LLCFGVVALAGSFAPADETEQVDRFLSRLGLVDLQILHLERSLDQPASKEAKLKTARRLADLYASRLLEAADEPERRNELLAGIEELTSRFPQANTTALEVMLLQADYNRAESLVGQWIADPQKTSVRDEAHAILSRIAPKLRAYQEELNEKVEQLYEEMEELSAGDALAEKESELRRIQGVTGRATYFAGWSTYYLGLTRGAPAEARGNFTTARDIFRKVLGLTGEDEDYEKVETAWLGLESPWRARSVIGLGLAEAAAGNLKGSHQVFSWLESAAVAPEIRDQAAYWYVQGLINAGHFTEAENYAAERIKEFTAAATQGKISLCVALIRAGFAAGASKAARELGPLGIAGLTRMRQFGALKTLIDRYEIDLSGERDFYPLWIRGQQQFDKAEQSNATADYEAAEELFTEALSADGADSDVASTAQCRYNRGWARYRLGKYLPAARDFEQAVTGLKAVDRETAVQSAWLAHACHRQLMSESPTAANAAIEMLQLIKDEFPDSSFAPRADYQIAKLRTAAASPEESIAALMEIRPGEENYLKARYDLCLLLHQQWQSAGGDADKRSELFDQLKSAVDVYRKAAGDAEPDRQLTCVLKVVDAALAIKPPDRTAAATYLGIADTLANRVQADDPGLAEFHYRSLQLARLTGNDAVRREHANWLVDHAAGSRYELAALVNVATALDKRIKSAAAEERSKLYREAYNVYTRLAQRLGDAPETIAAQKNARVAQSKRAYYAEQLGRHAEAAAALEKLLAAYPKDRDYLRRAALAQFHLRDYEASLEKWSTLLRGLPAGEDDWYEAKYHQIACLAEIDKPAAAKVSQQFQLLYPELGGANWRGRFEQLTERLK